LIRTVVRSLIGAGAALTVAAATPEARFPMKGGDSRDWPVVLRAGQLTDIAVTQAGVDVSVEIFDPSGKLLDSVDSPNGRNGDEPVSILAATSGTYRLRIAPIADDEPPGTVTIRTLALLTPAQTRAMLDNRRQARAEAARWLRPFSAPLQPAGLDPAVAIAPLDRVASFAQVIGLGEATHGSRELNDFRVRLSERLISRDHFRLITIEDSSTRWRRLEPYVSGVVAEPPLGAPLQWGWIGRRARYELLVAVRAWNLGHPGDRVRIVGVDPQDSLDAQRELSAFIAAAYGNAAADAWKPFAREFAEADEQTAVFGDSGVSSAAKAAVSQLLFRLEQDRELLAGRTPNIANAVMTARDLAQFADFNGRGDEMSRSRDWYMARNVLAAIADDPRHPKALYLGHNAHVAAARPSSSGGLLRGVLGCGYQAIGTTFGAGSFVAQLPNDPTDRLLVSTLPDAAEGSIESSLALVAPGPSLAVWGCGAASSLPAWLREAHPMHWIGGLYTPGSVPSASYRPYVLTQSFDGIAYFPTVAAEAIPSDRPVIAARKRTQP